jgi:hypothetical protein
MYFPLTFDVSCSSFIIQDVPPLANEPSEAKVILKYTAISCKMFL